MGGLATSGHEVRVRVGRFGLLGNGLKSFSREDQEYVYARRGNLRLALGVAAFSAANADGLAWSRPAVTSGHTEWRVLEGAGGLDA